MKVNKGGFIMSIEEVQTAIESSRREEESESLEEIKAEPKSASDYLDLILNDAKKLSGIIAYIGGLEQPREEDDDFSNLAWAMTDYTNVIEQSANDLWDHLRNIGTLQIKEIAKSTKE
jgi:hypothetical protein